MPRDQKYLPTVQTLDIEPSEVDVRIENFAEAIAQKILKAEADAINPNKITLGQVFGAYMSVRPIAAKTAKNYRQFFSLINDWANLPIHQIRQDMILDRHTELSVGGSTQANRCMRLLRALFNFAATYYETPSGKQIVGKNPVRILSAVRRWNKEKRRDRFIKPHELATWHATVQLIQNHAERDLILFLLFTGLRKSEGTHLRWADVDFDSGTFTVRDTKNGDDHCLPLSTYLYNLLVRRKAAAKGPYVFKSGARTMQPVCNQSYWHRFVSAKSGVEWSYHDLRRTFLTVADGLDIPKHIIKRLANHRTKDVTDGYLIQTADRLREPMQKVADKMLDLIVKQPNTFSVTVIEHRPELEPLKGWVEVRVLQILAQCGKPSMTTLEIHDALWTGDDEKRTRGSTGATVLRLEKRGYLVMVRRDKDCSKHYAISEGAKRMIANNEDRG